MNKHKKACKELSGVALAHVNRLMNCMSFTGSRLQTLHYHYIEEVGRWDRKDYPFIDWLWHEIGIEKRFDEGKLSLEDVTGEKTSPKFKVGDAVQLATGGSELVVTGIKGEGESYKAMVVYIDKDAELHTYEFDERCLRAVKNWDGEEDQSSSV